MTDDAALLDAIVHEPDDDLPRLAYADWCEESGQDARAEFIRVQLELARAGCAGERRKALLRREKSLRAGHERRWTKPFKPRLSKLGHRRGFVERAAVKAATFLDAPGEVLACAPIRALTLNEAGTQAHALARCELLARLTGLALPGAGADAIVAVLESPHLGRLESLDLSRNGLTVDALERLPAASFGRLKSLFLDGNDLGREAAPTRLAGLAPRLEVLSMVAPLRQGVWHELAGLFPSLRVVHASLMPLPLRDALCAEFPHIAWHFGHRPEDVG